MTSAALMTATNKIKKTDLNVMATKTQARSARQIDKDHHALTEKRLFYPLYET
jgi:hypothetical protein